MLRLKHDPPAEYAQWRRDFFDEHYETPTFEQRKHNFDGDAAMLRSDRKLHAGLDEPIHGGLADGGEVLTGDTIERVPIASIEISLPQPNQGHRALLRTIAIVSR